MLTVTGADDQSQTSTQARPDAWHGLGAVINGSDLCVTSTPVEGGIASGRVEAVMAGLPAAQPGTEAAAPTPLRNPLGDDLDRFIAVDPTQSGTESTEMAGGAMTESICGATDGRLASAGRRAGRPIPIGCTAWLIDGGAFLAAGHCMTE